MKKSLKRKKMNLIQSLFRQAKVKGKKDSKAEDTKEDKKDEKEVKGLTAVQKKPPAAPSRYLEKDG
jgi:hypothetical protein